MANAIHQRIEELVYIDDNLEFAKYDVIEKGLYLGEQLFAALRAVYRGVRGNPAAQAELAQALTLFHQKYFVPLDLPMPDWIEAYFDASAPTVFLPAIQSVDAWADKKLPSAE